MKTSLTFILSIFITISSFFYSNAQFDLTGYWKDQNNSHFYLRQIDDQLYWFAEDKNGLWANAFQGSIRNYNQTALFRGIQPTIVGEFYDLPKGKATGHGSLTLEIISATEIKKTAGSFGSITLRKANKPFILPREQSEGFSKSSIDGIWKGNDGGTYYLRQVGNKVIWYGEKTNGRKTEFSNVAFGSKLSDVISLKWIDVPKGATRGNGNIRLKISKNSMVKISGSGFGGSKWIKSTL